MSVVNSMLRDLDARSGEARKPSIPVRIAAPSKRSSTLLIAVALVAAGAVVWQYLPLEFISSVQPVSPPIVQAAVVAPAAPVAPPATDEASAANSQVAASVPLVTAASVQPIQAAPTPLNASWQWSADGFALQIDSATDVRYGIERVAASTLKISLAHAALPVLNIPAPTPSWIDSARVQRDATQQTVTISADSRLEYDVAMLDGGALVISVWRDASTASARSAEPAAFAEAGVAAEPVVAAAPVTERASTRMSAPRDYVAPRIDRSALTPAQRDSRQSAQATSQLRAGQSSQAVTTLRAVLQSGDAAPKSAALLVTILMSQQRLQEAQPYLDRALQQTPQDALLLKLKARLLAAQGDVPRAREVLAPLTPVESADTELLALAASLAQQAHDFAAATSYYLQWTRIDAASGSAWYGLALALDAQMSTASAIAAYQHALTLISDARLREYASTRVAALQGAAGGTATKDAAVAR